MVINTDLVDLEPILAQIIGDNTLHAKWLNTLSYMENCGARKIARCEHPTKVKEQMLKHAAEEFRHAYYLKQQIRKISNNPFDTYKLDTLLGGISSFHYLQTLDLTTCKFLKKTALLKSGDLKKAAYILVTYAIEIRASFLYPAYNKFLRKNNSKIHVKSIILEEEEHLHEMKEELEAIPEGNHYLEWILQAEAKLYKKWMEAIHLSVIK